MFDLKTMHLALVQLEEERKIPKDKIIEAIEQALAAAYKKDFGKKGQIIRCHFNLETGTTEFYQVKIVVDDSIVRIIPEEEEYIPEEGDERVRFNEEHHIFLDDARKIKTGSELEDEIIFSLENKDDFGRIAAQTAKQVIIQKIREAERSTIIDEYGDKEGEIISGYVQKTERGNIYVEFNRAVGQISFEEQIPGERWNRGDRIRAYLFAVEESPRGVNLRLSRTHPKFLELLFSLEAPEIATGVVEIVSIAREPGSRSKIAVKSNDPHIDPVGSCVGQRGVRVNAVTSELSGEKIDIIPWNEDIKTFITNSLSPAKVTDITIDDSEHKANIEVAEDQLSLAIGKGGQNVRLAAKLTGWRIDIKGNGLPSELDQTGGNEEKEMASSNALASAISEAIAENEESQDEIIADFVLPEDETIKENNEDIKESEETESIVEEKVETEEKE
jgi:transcription termination/antitermination protein NusA